VGSATLRSRKPVHKPRLAILSYSRKLDKALGLRFEGFVSKVCTGIPKNLKNPSLA